jgi:hypothetical protein
MFAARLPVLPCLSAFAAQTPVVMRLSMVVL